MMDSQQGPRRKWKVAPFGWCLFFATALFVRYLFWEELRFAQQLLLTAVFAVSVSAAIYIVHLVERVKHLERRLDLASMDVVNIVNRMATAILHPTPVEAENLKAGDTRSALELIDHYIGHRLFQHIPALRRVLYVSILLSRDVLCEKAGITDEELTGLEHQFSTAWLGPASALVIEEWSTHTVIFDDTDHQQPVQYKHNASPYYSRPTVIWKHTIPRSKQDSSDGTLELVVEIVIHRGCIKCWAVDGRFGRSISPDGVAKEEHVFVSIPMEEDGLAQYLEIDSIEDPEMRTAQRPWIRHYDHEASDKKFRWHLTVNDVVSYVRERG